MAELWLSFGWIMAVLRHFSQNFGHKPPGAAFRARDIYFSFFAETIQKRFDLTARKSWQDLLKFRDWRSDIAAAAYMLQQKLFVGVSIQSTLSGVFSGFTGRDIIAAGKNILAVSCSFYKTDVLQTLGSRLENGISPLFHV